MEMEIDKIYGWWCEHCGYFEDYPLVHDPNYSICPSCGRLIHKRYEDAERDRSDEMDETWTYME